MMIKVFTTDRNGKITLSEKELKELLDEAYWEGYRNNNNTWIYRSPSWSPFIYTTTGNTSTITLSNKAAEESSTISSGYVNTGTTYNTATTSCSSSCGGGTNIKSGCYKCSE